ncbi:MAG: hypothetical protein J6I66_01975 [Lachnospiraceae bacterium]|nr:hypothetical protein [Lachnospiraceae bacterium]
METIISSCITGIIAIITCLITQASANKKTLALVEYKLDELQKKVDKHNNVIERTYKLEELTALQEEKIKVANHRIDDLERKEA